MTKEIIPICQGCKQLPKDIEEYFEAAIDADMEVNEYVRQEEGTYNPSNGHFLCTDCYIKAGMPSSNEGWICP